MGTANLLDLIPGVSLGKSAQPTISTSLQRERPGPLPSSPVRPVSLPSQGQCWPPKPPNLGCESCYGEKLASFQLRGRSKQGSDRARPRAPQDQPQSCSRNVGQVRGGEEAALAPSPSSLSAPCYLQKTAPQLNPHIRKPPGGSGEADLLKDIH